MRLAFRTAKRSDIERLVAIHAAAYPDPRSMAARARNFETNGRGSLSDLVVATSEGAIVAHAFLFRLRGWFGGREVAVGGVASVAVAPEVRGRGVATAMMRELHRRSHARGDAITMLYPFRQGFYARAGYAPTPSRKRLQLTPTSIPRAWSEAALGRVTRVKGHDKRALAVLHAKVSEQRTGWFRRTPAVWEHRWCREELQHLVLAAPRSRGTSAVEGYVAFVIQQAELHAETRVVVEDLVASTDEGRRLLLGALGTLRDQVSNIELEIPEDDPLDLALVDADGARHGNERVEHSLGVVVGGPMVRLDEDVARAVEARGYRGDGELVVELTDDSRRLHLRVVRGRAKVETTKATAARMRTTRAGLASVLYGGLPASQAAAIGLVEAPAAVLATADRLFAMPKLWVIDPF